MRQHIDGVWHNSEARDRESGDVMLAVMKKIAGLDINERRMRQQGRFAAKFQDVKYVCTLTSQGVQTGERVILQIEGPRVKVLHSLTSMGCPAGPMIQEGIHDAVASLPGVEQVEVELTFDPPWTPDLMSDDAKFILGFG